MKSTKDLVVQRNKPHDDGLCRNELSRRKRAFPASIIQQNVKHSSNSSVNKSDGIRVAISVIFGDKDRIKNICTLIYI